MKGLYSNNYYDHFIFIFCGCVKNTLTKEI